MLCLAPAAYPSESVASGQPSSSSEVFSCISSSPELALHVFRSGESSVVLDNSMPQHLHEKTVTAILPPSPNFVRSQHIQSVLHALGCTPVLWLVCGRYLGWAVTYRTGMFHLVPVLGFGWYSPYDNLYIPVGPTQGRQGLPFK